MTSATGRFKALTLGLGVCEEPRQSPIPGSIKLRRDSAGSTEAVYVARDTAIRQSQRDASLAHGTPAAWDYTTYQVGGDSNFEFQMARVIGELRSGTLPSAPAETWKLAGEALNRRANVDLSDDGWVTKLAETAATLDD